MPPALYHYLDYPIVDCFEKLVFDARLSLLLQCNGCMNDLEVYQYLDWIIRYSCLKTGAHEFGINDHDQLINGIKNRNPEIYNLVSDFVSSYKSWFEFSKQMMGIWQNGKPTESQIKQLVSLTDHRDEKRRLLADKLKSLH